MVMYSVEKITASEQVTSAKVYLQTNISDSRNSELASKSGIVLLKMWEKPNWF